MSTHQLESIMNQIQRLSSVERLQLIKRIADSLGVEAVADKTTDAEEGLVYGKYRSTTRKMSTEEDFRLAEWHPTERELNGE
jgi:hypothetical protein